MPGTWEPLNKRYQTSERGQREREERGRERESQGAVGHAHTRARGAAQLSVLAACGEQRETVEAGCAAAGLQCKFKSLDFLSCRKPAKPEAKAVGDIAIVLDRLLFVVWTASFAPPNALPCQEMNIRTYEAFRCHTARTLNEYLIYKSLWLRLWGTRRDPV